MMYAAMLIVADENMPRVRDWFSAVGEVKTLPGRSLNAAAVRDADILLVRSVTRTDRALLDGSNVRFVGSATIGTDHLDLDYLAARGIAYANAPGSNANAVVDYVLSCFAAIDGLFERLANGASVGIVGLGNVGSRLYRRLHALGFRCIGYDPFLSNDSALPLATLEAVLAADIVCCHAPLTRNGKYPTWHMLNSENLARLRANSVLINAGRGPVIENAALPQWLSQRPQASLVLDVWEQEPHIKHDLLQHVTIATPHIAGYSLDGRLAGTRMVFEACCAFLRMATPAVEQQDALLPSIHLNSALADCELMRAAIQAVYDVRTDDAQMRAALHACDSTQTGQRFDELRKHYSERREFSAVRIANWCELSAEKQQLLQRLGFIGAAH